jgi:hypothetical protein
VELGQVPLLRQGQLAALASQKAEIPRIHLGALPVLAVNILREGDDHDEPWTSW